ncbi:helix-turn-helix domain-containing protein [Calderihabitans maritimus]|uniref:AraC family transcriptional regulator n=1 Tax=Calderihabitans maritimus TaxID=1246530 RepID=A0A1Z5HUQ4_9FIRM|nr:helix-turn-helix domain-containing protein [Calderihabitans maritimus]GAW93138.1 AraC family transcriptional regulator [Calderihabitans maritimus]
MKVNGSYLRSLREERGYTLREFAEKAGISPAYLSQIENNQKTPSIKTLQKLARALNLDKEQLIVLTEPTPGISLARKLHALRTAKNLTLDDLAKQSGLRSGYLAQVEAGMVYPPYSVIARLAEALEVTTSALFAAEKGNLGDKLRALRQERQLTLEQLAKSIGVSPGLLWQIEQGRVQPSLETLEKLSKVFGIDACLFFLDEDISPPFQQNSTLQKLLQQPEVMELLEMLQDMDRKDLETVKEMVKLFKNSRK